MSKAQMQHEMPVEVFSEPAHGINPMIETYKYAAFLIEDGYPTLEGEVFEFTGPALVARAKLASHLFDMVLQQVSDEFNEFTGEQIFKIWGEYYTAAKLIMDGDLMEAIDGCEVNMPDNHSADTWSFKIYSF